MFYNIAMCLPSFKNVVSIYTFLSTPLIVNKWQKEVKVLRPQIGLELFNLTLYIVILSILIDEENKKYIFDNNYVKKLEI